MAGTRERHRHRARASPCAICGVLDDDNPLKVPGSPIDHMRSFPRQSNHVIAAIQYITLYMNGFLKCIVVEFVRRKVGSLDIDMSANPQTEFIYILMITES